MMVQRTFTRSVSSNNQRRTKQAWKDKSYNRSFLKDMRVIHSVIQTQTEISRAESESGKFVLTCADLSSVLLAWSESLPKQLFNPNESHIKMTTRVGRNIQGASLLYVKRKNPKATVLFWIHAL